MNCKWQIVYSYLLCCISPCVNAIDINSVIVRGDSANYGMWINFVKEFDYGFKVATTGAEFVFDKKTCIMKAYQRIGADRQVAQVQLGEGGTDISMIINTPDHVVFDANNFFIAIYGDSTCIIAARRDEMMISCTGDFLPEYAGQRAGEVIFIDDKGGIAVLPQRHETGYKVLTMRRFENPWCLRYAFKQGQRLMLAVFPPRTYNYKQSFQDRFVFSNGVIVKQISKGQLVDDDTIRAWRKYANIIVLLNGGLYYGRNDWAGYVYPGEAYKYSCGGPYCPVQPQELKRVVSTAHSVGFKVLIYVSPFYHYKSPDAEAFYADAEEVYHTYNIDGFYIDGMYMDWSQGSGCLDDKIKNYEIVRRLRQLVGPKGIIFYHGSGDRSEVAAVPNIDAICDFVLYGETVKFKTLQDTYIKFQVRKYGISNTIGMIRTNRAPQFTEDEVIDAMLKMHNRERWSAHPTLSVSGSRYIWPKEPPPFILRYYDKLNKLQKDYEEKQESHQGLSVD